jgi:hypothetical protein
MKKLLLLLALLIPSASAEESVFYTYEAMQCMKLRECTEGVRRLSSEDYEGEAKTIISNLDKMGVEVYNAIPQYFVDEYRAVYYSDRNSIFINERYTQKPERFLSMLRHEAWHAAQDCMAGGMHNSDILSILSHEVIPDEIVEETFSRYGFDDPEVFRIEREAVWAMYKPNMTVKALQACNSDTPMWETYFPPKRTWRWLYWNGHLEHLY